MQTEHATSTHEQLLLARRVLILTHLAIGDFVYWQPYLRALVAAYPQATFDIWIDEVRRTWLPWRWQSLARYSLYEWVAQTGLFGQVYKRTYSPFVYRQSRRQAAQVGYDVVISLATLRPHQYISLARSISPQGHVAALTKPYAWWQACQGWSYSKTDTSVPVGHYDPSWHIAQRHAQDVQQLCGLTLSAGQSMPKIDVPSEWIAWAKLKLMQWGIDKVSKPFGKIIFLNAFAKEQKRTWPLESVAQFIATLRVHDVWQDVQIVVSAPPEHAATLLAKFGQGTGANLFLFSANKSFFQLPAMIAQADLVVSVETAVMHLAAVQQVPVVALMRQKNPEWRPWGDKAQIVWAAKRSDWVAQITPEAVAAVVVPLLASDQALHTEH